MTSKQTRSQHSKSRRGCQTCRTRRIKCDEAKPYCQRCTSTGRTCDGYPAAHIILYQHERRRAPQGPPTEINALPWLVQHDERRAFAFFLAQAAPVLAGALDSDCWSVLVPRLAQTNIVIRYAIFAMSHFFENPVYEVVNGRARINPVAQKHIDALNWHARALSTDRMRPLQRSSTDLLLKCVLFSSLEFQQNNFQAGLKMVRVVFLLLAPMITAGCGGVAARRADGIVDTLIPMAMRNSCLLFSSHEAVGIQLLPESATEGLETTMFAVKCAVYGTLKDVYVARDTGTFSQSYLSTLPQVQTRARLNSLKDRIADTIRHSGSSEQLQALIQYGDICLSWVDFLERTSASTELSCQDFLVLVLAHTRTILATSSTRYPQASSTTFFYEMVISPSAYLVAIFTSDPELRREALTLTYRKTVKSDSNAQLLAIVLSLDADKVQPSKQPFQNMLTIFYGQKDQPGRMNKACDIYVEVSASDRVGRRSLRAV